MEGRTLTLTRSQEAEDQAHWRRQCAFFPFSIEILNCSCRRLKIEPLQLRASTYPYPPFTSGDCRLVLTTSRRAYDASMRFWSVPMGCSGRCRGPARLSRGHGEVCPRRSGSRRRCITSPPVLSGTLTLRTQTLRTRSVDRTPT